MVDTKEINYEKIGLADDSFDLDKNLIILPEKIETKDDLKSICEKLTRKNVTKE